MKKDLGSSGELFPQSVFIVGSYDEAGVPNAMNVAWGGTASSAKKLAAPGTPASR